MIAAAAVGAIVGNCIGFGVGWFGGYPLLRRFGKYVRLNEPQVKVGRYIFMRYGTKVVFFGRFVSILRTYLAFLAGANRMPWPRFLARDHRRERSSGRRSTGLAAYALGSQISHLSLPVEIAFIALAVVAIIAGHHLHQVPGQAARGNSRRGVPRPARGLPE